MSFMDKYLDKFPYFMDKSDDSNNYKHHDITGGQLKDVKQTLASLNWDKELKKPIQITRLQEEEGVYEIHFIINVDIKNILFKKEDIYIEPVEIETGHYVYSDECETIIPEEKFSCIVETPNEEIWTHGIPENDTPQKNEFDHDLSLDQIGGLLGVQRLTYITVKQADYPFTSPPYNNQTIESDYDYSERLRKFCNNIQKKPLPLSYLQAWLAVDGILINREKELCKMAPGDIYGDLPEDDAPLPFEHRDLMCQGTGVEDLLFKFTVNTRRPLESTVLVFNFQFIDALFNNVEVPGVIVPYINGNNNDLGVITNNKTWSKIASDLGEDEFFVRFKYFNNVGEAEAELEAEEGVFLQEGLYTEEQLFSIISCANADVYVSTTGSDETGDGSESNPYKTVKYGVSKTLMNDTVSLMEGDFTEGLIEVKNSINLVTCYGASISTNGRVYMTLSPQREILIDGIEFIKGDESTTLQSTLFKSNCNKEVNIIKTDIHISTSAVVGEATVGKAIIGTGEEE